MFISSSWARGAEELHIQAFTECIKSVSPSEVIMFNAISFQLLTDKEHCTETLAVAAHRLVLFVSFIICFYLKSK